MAKRQKAPKTISEQLRRFIKDSGLSTYQLQHETGVHNSMLSRFLRDERGLRIEAVDALCEYLKLRLVSKDEGD